MGLLIEAPTRSGITGQPPTEQDLQLGHLAVAIEQFLQSSTLGEFANRLRLLSTFERHVEAEVCLTHVPTCSLPRHPQGRNPAAPPPSSLEFLDILEA